MWLPRPRLLALVGSALLTRVASGQATTVPSTVSALPVASAAFAGSVAVSIASGAVQSLGNVVDGVANTFPAPVSITLTWDLHPSTGSVQIVGYFTSATAAMTSGSSSIPASWIKGRVITAGAQDAPTSFTAFAQSGTGGVGMSGSSLALLTQPIRGYNRTGSQTIELELQLDLTGRVLDPGTYSGTLNIRAVTQ